MTRAQFSDRVDMPFKHHSSSRLNIPIRYQNRHREGNIDIDKTVEQGMPYSQVLTLKQRSKYVLADGEEHSTWTAPRDIQLGYISFGSRGKISGRVS